MKEMVERVYMIGNADFIVGGKDQANSLALNGFGHKWHAAFLLMMNQLWTIMTSHLAFKFQIGPMC